MTNGLMSYLRRIHWAVWLGTLLVAIPGSFVLLWGMSATRQRAVYEKLSNKCDCYFSGNLPVIGESSIGRFLGPLDRWIEQHEVLDIHWRRRVIEVNCYRGATDADIHLIVQMPHLWTLALRGKGISGPGLRDIARLRELTTLRLNGTSLTEQDLAALREMKQLRRLSIESIPLTGRGLRHLQSLSELRELNLWGTVVADEDLALLRSLKQLESLTLSRTPMTGRGLQHLRGLSHLNEIDLSWTQLDRKGLETVGTLRQVRYLYLRGVPLISAELKAGLLKCHQLHVVKVKLDDQDQEELRRAFPGISITDLE